MVTLLLLALVSASASEPPAPQNAYEVWAAGRTVHYVGAHRMEPGETAWGISQAVGVPVPVLRALSTLDLDHLQVGDWVAFPVTDANLDAAGVWNTPEECGC